MPQTLLIPGRRAPSLEGRDPDTAGPIEVEIVRSYTDFGAVRGGVDQRFEEADDDDILEMEYDDGVVRFISVREYRQQAAARGATRGLAGEGLRIESEPVGPYATRGVGGWVLRKLNVLRSKIDVEAAIEEKIQDYLTDNLARAAAVLLAEQFEKRLPIGPGLYRCSDPNRLLSSDKIQSADDLSGGDPYLVFLHGTMSSTSGSFGGLTETGGEAVARAGQEWKNLVAQYGNRILALEHRTLSESPLQNAVQLAERLPANARLHLVSHSRGGLVGELLCLRPSDLELYPGRTKSFVPRLGDGEIGESDEADRNQIETLRRLLDQKQLRVERFVRVACPARGTILASNRLDWYASGILTAIGWIPVLKTSVLYRVVKAMLLALLKQRAEPQCLPGLEAQMPDSPLIRLINNPAVQSSTELGVISGDLEGTSGWWKILEIATDLFYWEDHDLVVNTNAMSGGAARRQAYRFPDRGSEVNHFRYFRNPKTRGQMYYWLTRKLDGDTGRFESFDIRSEDHGAMRGIVRSRPDGSQPIIYFLPGIMGSHLRVGSDQVWMNMLSLAGGGLKRLSDVTDANVQADGILARSYQKLIDHLSTTHDVRPFAYDWRRSISDIADVLAKQIRETIPAAPANGAAANNRPIRLLAHSMGGLVVRAMIATHKDLWDSLCANHDCRFVMLGTPNRGSFAIPRMLLGRERLVRMLAMLDLRHSQEDLIKIIASFPGVLELMPDEFFGNGAGKESANLFDRDWKPLDKDSWKRAMGDASQVRKSLAADMAHVDRVVYVAGSAVSTPCAIIETAIGEKKELIFQATTRGDGRVTWESGELLGVKTWYVPAEHGELANHEPSFSGIVELLEKGHTKLLDDKPPLSLRGEDRFPLPREDVALFPNDEDLIGAALGFHPSVPAITERTALRVSVAHGDLRYARFPVLLGHHEDDTIVSAEARLDTLFGGRLSERYQLGLYPGPVGSHVIVRNPRNRDFLDTAIIVGLGRVGELTPTMLTESVTSAVLRYLLELAEQQFHQQAEQRRDEDTQPSDAADASAGDGAADSGHTPVGITALLVGSGVGSPLLIKDSVQAIVRGVLLANQRLREVRPSERMLIEEIEFLECFEDRAIAAAHEVRELNRRLSPGLETKLVVSNQLIERRGGLRRVMSGQGVENWWQRIQVTKTRQGLRFVTLTERAQVPVITLLQQREMIDRLIADAVTRPQTNRQLAETLFELLIPHDLKSSAREQRNLVLVLDSTTANYPWEILLDRRQGHSEPRGVRSGLIRQLATERFRQRPLAARDNKAFIVGNPWLGDAKQQSAWAEQPWPSLPSAEKEANAVSKLLKESGFNIDATHIDEEAETIIVDLFSRDYRILHIAAHGHFIKVKPRCQKKETTRSAVVLGKGLYLTASEIQQLPVIPELVFLNCCHLGKTDESQLPPNANQLAAGIAQELIGIGVRCVIAAGWAVVDEAASVFAEVFYGELLRGETFGQAVLQARKTTYDQFPNYNTWGAYQAYGDPDYRLTVSGVDTATDDRKFVSRREYLQELENIATEEELSDDARRRALSTRLNKLLGDMPDEYGADGEVVYRLARAFKTVGDLKRAVEFYEKALQFETGAVPITAIEQLANLESRLAAHEAQQETVDLNQAKKTACRGIDRLQRLLKISPTRERHSLLGSAYKGLAQLTKGMQRRKALEEAAKSYEQAHQEYFTLTGRFDNYPLLNALTCRYLLGEKLDNLDEQLDRSVHDAEARRKADPSFWNYVARPDAELVRHLAKGDLREKREYMVGLYEGVRSKGTRGEFHSVLSQLDFVITMLEDPKLGRGRSQTLDDLRSIRAALGRGSDPLITQQGQVHNAKGRASMSEKPLPRKKEK